ncbi:MAG: OmpA family protein [Verrucomicrobiota bacterium]
MRILATISTVILASALALLSACSDSKDKESKAELATKKTEEPGTEKATPDSPTSDSSKGSIPPPREMTEGTADPDTPDTATEEDATPRIPGFPDKFTNGSQITKTIASKLSAGETDDVFAFLGDELLAAPRANGFRWALTAGGYAIDPEEPIQDVGELGVLQRQALLLVKADEDGNSVDREKTYLDLRRDAKSGWRVEALSVSPTLRAKALRAGLPEPLPEMADNAPTLKLENPDGQKNATPPDGKPALVLEPNAGDALTDADTFLTAVLEQDYLTAVQLCDPEKVPEEKIAALCIVFEEGEYRMKPVKPLMATASGEQSKVAWIIAHVESDKIGVESEFGIEMKHDSEKGWRIAGLNFSEMLARFADASEAGKVPFTPLVKKPEGGESLVLYFEYDDADVTQRAKRQIEIISSILRNDPDKRLRVSGHADALGTDEYNKRLSKERARSVKALLADLGVPADQIVTEAVGENYPLRPNTLPDGTDDPTGRSHNRRAELYLDF